jgi:hypothetical protein
MSYRRFKGNIKPEFLRLKEAMLVFSMGSDKIEALAKECGAYYKVDKVVLIDYDTMREYIESFREG